ncbi:hypothetical protein E5K00_07390 [Hymenobacter aquaticus]|uniref:Outer membrane protein beta-barrel domain-containing protein n=1 Tax=Hymenobacter aquaticus TaxID=1867101 RepID=A0A4Z0Q5W5_9BACT|nr:outer membrane beta-barrel protein [Hymenobacter aquaticus]TGE25014.1 hypothetical protein E5K00_07390 [Hymenobacter aquaticus]
MTEFESEKFYHDLRQKLDGYGSAPPESVWAGIREQVPARQRRRRPIWLALAACTLLVCLTVGLNQWKSFFTLPTDVGSAADNARGTARAAAARTKTMRTATAAPTEATGASAVASTAASASPDASALPSRTSPTASAAPAPNAGSPRPTTGAAAGATLPQSVTPGLGLTRTGRPRPPQLAALNATHPTRRVAGRPAADMAGPSATAAPLVGSRARRARTSGAGAAGLLAGNSTRRRTRRFGQPTDQLGAAPQVAAASPGRRAYNRRSRALSDASQSGLSSELTTTEAGRRTGSRRRSRAPQISNDRLALLVLRPAALQVEEPDVERAHRNAPKRPTRQELRLRNWSAQLLLGSGLTYRVLGGTPTQLETLERPSLGFSGQATASYAFSRQLAVSAGVGYAEYATTLRYDLQKAGAETVTKKDFRDVYRFLTVPVQAQLTLGGNPRWRYGVLGGGTLGILAGAKTTEGSACNCQQTQWTSSTQELPFARASLLLSGGAFASYQFAVGQWFTIRPQGQIFLNSLTDPAAGRTARRPWSLGLQAGYSWDLDPRNKH